MAMSFLSFFKRKPKEEPVVEPAAAPRPAVEKSSSDRLSKTVMPNSTRTVAPQEAPAPMATIAATPSPVSMPAPAPVMAGPAAPRTVAFAPSEPSRSPGLPPAVAVQLEPTVERAVSLELADIVGQMPEGWVRPLDGHESSRRVLLKAAEIERGMASGKPSVLIASVYQQVPEIFRREVAASESARVMLPFGKVLDEFAALHVRSDQRPEAAVPQVETPFLKVTAEDSERFGIAPTPIAPPSVRVEPATAETLAKAEPEAFRAPAAPSGGAFPLRIPVPATARATNGHAEAEPRPAPISLGSPSPAAAPTIEAPKPAPAAPARIPFKLSPNGTGVPATERVPASSGPPVPTSLPKAGAPARIPFKLPTPGASAAPKTAGEPWITKESFEAEAAAPELKVVPSPGQQAGADQRGGATMISLALRPIFEGLPPFQLVGDPTDVPREARVELPFDVVEPQLVTGRVTLTPEQFAAGLPEEYRGLFNPADSAATVSLPLQEVLKNLPASSLRMRDDQEEQEKGSAFATPFSAKAEEDAKRLKVAATPIPKPVAPAVEPMPTATPRVLPSPAAEAEAEKPAAKVASVTRTELQLALDTDEELDPKSVVVHIGKMPGVKACAIIFEDGLSLAGDLPPEFNAEGLSAMAPSMMQRIEAHMGDSQLGSLRAMTLSCANAAVTFLTHNKLCLAALHAREELSADVRDRLARTVQELSKTYSQPA